MDVVGAEELIMLLAVELAVLSRPNPAMDVVGAAELLEALTEAAPAK